MDQGIDLAEERAKKMLRQDDAIFTWGDYREWLHQFNEWAGSLGLAPLDAIDPGSELVD